jgi:hypothetical protein
MLDERVEAAELNGPDLMVNFAVSRSMECSCIRLTQTDTNWSGDFLLELYAFEVFGTLLEYQE